MTNHCICSFFFVSPRWLQTCKFFFPSPNRRRISTATSPGSCKIEYFIDAGDQLKMTAGDQLNMTFSGCRAGRKQRDLRQRQLWPQHGNHQAPGENVLPLLLLFLRQQCCLEIRFSPSMTIFPRSNGQRCYWFVPASSKPHVIFFQGFQNLNCTFHAAFMSIKCPPLTTFALLRTSKRDTTRVYRM